VQPPFPCKHPSPDPFASLLEYVAPEEETPQQELLTLQEFATQDTLLQKSADIHTLN